MRRLLVGMVALSSVVSAGVGAAAVHDLVAPGGVVGQALHVSADSTAELLKRIDQLEKAGFGCDQTGPTTATCS